MAARSSPGVVPRAASASAPDSGRPSRPPQFVIATIAAPCITARFPRGARVRERAEFTRVFDGGRRFAHPLLSLHWLRDEQPPRLGLAVSRKVDPHAVGRNRIKRALREQFRRLRTQLAAGAYVVVARPGAARVESAELRAAFSSVLQRAGALPQLEAPGTMPAADRQDIPPPSSMPRPRAG